MSMIRYVLGITAAQDRALRENPHLVSDVTAVAEQDEEDESLARMLRDMPPEQRAEREAWLRKLETDPASQADRDTIAQNRRAIASLGPFAPALNLENSWHVLHYLFAGRALPIGAVEDMLLTGEPIGDDNAYGPACLHDWASTQAFAKFLAAQDLSHLLARANMRELRRQQIYGLPSGPDREAAYEVEVRDDVRHFFPALRDYVGDMAKKQNGLLIWLV